MYWNTDRIALALKLPAPTQNQPIIEITTNSKAVKPGSLFIAIVGDTHDGHEFIPQAIANGAVAIISEKPYSDTTVPLFQVSSTITAIRLLAREYRQTFKIPVLGIVGSVGKTTTKELIASLLQGKYQHILKTEGSQNGFLGIALTLLNLKPETEIAVIEIGIDDIGAMDQHITLVEPTHVIVTALGPEHLHQLKTVEIAAEEELRAFDYALNEEKKLAINLADPYVKNWFEKNKSHLIEKNYLSYSQTDSVFLSDFPSPLPGAHHEHNLLAAVTMGKLLGLTTEEMKAGLKTFKTAFGRTEIHNLNQGITVIGDYYNSNPTSLSAALHLLKEKGNTQAKTHAALADMLELGSLEESFHRQMANEIINCKIDSIYLYGTRMKWLEAELKEKNFLQVKHFESHEALATALKQNLKPNDTVLVKGSRGMKMETVLKLLS